MKNPIIGFAGMTHLGLNSAVATAERGFTVICFDGNQQLIANLTNQQLHITEPQLPELIAKNINSQQLTFHANPKKLFNCDIVYIAPDVPTDGKGISDLTPIHQIIENVLPHLNPTALLIILCQVPPGFTRKLEKQISLNRVYYQVETLIFGRAIERALYPERFIIGCDQPSSAIEPRFRKLLDAFNCPILPMRYESAELAKISINCCLVASISVANTLSEICEKIGADWHEIIPALKLDKRIGQYAYLAPGLGIAGGNLERDLTTVLNLGNTHGTETSVVKSWVGNSLYKKDWVLKILHQHIFSKYNNPKLAVLGLAYKENTHSTKNSPSLELLQHLIPYQIQVYDPVVNSDIVPWVAGKSSIAETLKDADVLIIMTPWAEFRNITSTDLQKNMRNKIIIDPYRLLKGDELKQDGFQYLTMGTNVTC